MSNICRAIQHYGPLAARIFFAQLFIISALGKIGGFAKTAAFIANSGLPLPEALLVLTIALEIGASILLVLGWQARWAAAGLFVFTLLAAVIFHAFWRVEPALFTSQLNNFMKNLAIMGGLLYVMAYGPGPISLGKDRYAETADAHGGSAINPALKR